MKEVAFDIVSWI